MTDHPRLDEFVSAAATKGFPRDELERWGKMMKNSGLKAVQKEPRWSTFCGHGDLMRALVEALKEQVEEMEDPATGLNQLFSQINAQ